jgi:hypothetical protein
VNVIGPKVNLTAGAMSVAIDRLEVRGLVARVEGKRDRRVRMVALTKEGEKMISPVYSRHAALLERIFEPLSESQRLSLEGMLKAVETTLRLRPKCLRTRSRHCPLDARRNSSNGANRAIRSKSRKGYRQVPGVWSATLTLGLLPACPSTTQDPRRWPEARTKGHRLLDVNLQGKPDW